MTLNFSFKKSLYIGLLLLCLLCCVGPLINLVYLGFEGLSLALFQNPSWRKAMANTFWMSLFATFFSLVLGFVSAFLVVRTDVFGAKRFKTLILYPYIIPTSLSAIAWTILANPRVGWLKPLAPFLNIYSIEGVIWVESLYWYTFVFLNVSATFANLDTSLEESARMCGASSRRVFCDVTLPLLKQTLLASSLIVMTCVASSFAVPAIVGGPGQFYVITTKIYQSVKIGTPEALISAMALSLPILILAFGVIYYAEHQLNRLAFATVGGKATRSVSVRLKKWRWPAFLFLLLVSFFAFILPGGTLILASLMQTLGRFEFSLANYKHVFLNPETYFSLWHSFYLALVGSFLLTTFGFFISYFKIKTKYKGRHFLTTLASLPFATPGTILALAILYTLNGHSVVVLLLLAYVTKYLSHAIKVMTPAVSQVHISLEEASLMCGATFRQTLACIWLPLLKTAFSSCVFLMVAPLFSELTLSILITNTDFPTLGTRLFHLQEYGSPNEASVLAVLVLALVMGLNALIKKISGSRLGI